MTSSSSGPGMALVDLRASGHQILVTWSVDTHVFNTTYWYDFDLSGIRERFGEDFFGRLLLHIALFEINKGASLRPARLALGTWTRFLTPALAALWDEVLFNAWGQWRWEHDDPTYRGPTLPAPGAGSAAPVRRRPEPASCLVFCGGGKDSLVAMDILERADIEYSAFVYSSSVYGPARRQHELIGDLIQRAQPVAVHRQWVYDDFLDTPVLDHWHATDVHSLTAAETPSSVFASLPVVLHHGCRHIVLAHERSANRGNLVWDRTGEEINHQWGKSLAAERLIDSYIRQELVADLSYFSILQPVHDALIFALLRRRLDAVPFTHSCNVRKPWCGRCPKCAYVWINYKAWLPWSVVDPMFDGGNLLDVAENQVHFEQMLGLHDHTPFECIGGIAEAQLAFAMARRRGLAGLAMDTFAARVPEQDWPRVAEPYLAVSDEHGIPGHLAGRLLDDLRAQAHEARRYLSALFSGAGTG